MGNKEQKGDLLSDMLRNVLKTFRQTLYTATPGIIVSYDRATRRASIQPTPRTAFIDGTYGSPPILPNVPVVLPFGGNFILDVPLVAGDPVMIVYAQRGIKKFKKTFSQEDPSGGALQSDAAVAFPGFGPLSITPGAGISLQKTDGSVKVDIKDSEVEVKVGELGGMTLNSDGSIDFANGASLTASGDFVTSAGISLDNHVHGGVQTGAGTTGAPQ